MKYNIGYFGNKRLEKSRASIATKMLEKQTICFTAIG